MSTSITDPDGLVALENATTPNELAEIAGISHHTVRRWMSKGLRGERLAHRRVGNRIITSREALECFMQRQEQLREQGYSGCAQIGHHSAGEVDNLQQELAREGL